MAAFLTAKLPVQQNGRKYRNLLLVGELVHSLSTGNEQYVAESCDLGAASSLRLARLSLLARQRCRSLNRFDQVV
jgi:hypothetical protein